MPAVGTLAAPGAPEASALRLEAMLDAAPAIERAAADVEAGQAAVRLERVQRMPDVALIVGSKREGPERERVRAEHHRPVGAAAAVQPQPGRYPGRREACRQSRAELEATRLRVRTEALQAHARMQAAVQQERLVREDAARARYAADAAR